MQPDDAWTAAAYEVMRAEEAQPLAWWWLSFCDPKRPEGQQFLGVAIVEAHGPVTAGIEAHARGCNPGGEMACWGPLPDEAVPAQAYRNRLLTKAETEEANPNAAS